MASKISHEMIKDAKRVESLIRRLPSSAEYKLHGKFSLEQIKAEFGSWLTFYQALPSAKQVEDPRTPKILIFDIETAPIIAHVWDIWDQNIGINQIIQDWHLMSWAAKWLDEKEIFYKDQRNAKPIHNDKEMLMHLWDLLDEADVVITQNGKRFDSKKVNARFLIHDIRPPSGYDHIDTLQIAKKHFAMTSNKLEYLSDKVNKNEKKSQHRNFSGFELWRECISGNKLAWDEMEKYNRQDVLATEELYKKLSPWGGTGVDLNAYRGSAIFSCQCGSINYVRDGYRTTKTAKTQRYRCNDCGASFSERGTANNLFTEAKKLSLRGHI